jgi:hypothetical protein
MIDAEVTGFSTRSSSADLLRVPDLELAVAC